MKIISHYREIPKTEVILYGTPTHAIRKILNEDPNIEKIVKEYKPRKFKPTGQDTFIQPDRSLRHQIMCIKEVIGFLNIKLYSVPLNSADIRNLELKPIESVEKKEKLEKAIEVLKGVNY